MCESIKDIKKLGDLAGFRIVSVFTAHDNPQCEPLSFKDSGERVYSLEKKSLQERVDGVEPSSPEPYRRKIVFQSEVGLMTPKGEVFLLSDFNEGDGKPVSLLRSGTKLGALKWPGPPF